VRGEIGKDRRIEVTLPPKSSCSTRRIAKYTFYSFNKVLGKKPSTQTPQKTEGKKYHCVAGTLKTESKYKLDTSLLLTHSLPRYAFFCRPNCCNINYQHSAILLSSWKILPVPVPVLFSWECSRSIPRSRTLIAILRTKHSPSTSRWASISSAPSIA